MRQNVAEEITAALAAQPISFVKIVIKGTLQMVQSSDSLPSFGDNVFIDNSLNSENLRERIAQISSPREKTKLKGDYIKILRKS